MLGGYKSLHRGFTPYHSLPEMNPNWPNSGPSLIGGQGFVAQGSHARGPEREFPKAVLFAGVPIAKNMLVYAK